MTILLGSFAAAAGIGIGVLVLVALHFLFDPQSIRGRIHDIRPHRNNKGDR